MFETHRLIHLLVEDRDLGAELSRQELRRAREAVVVPSVRLPQGEESALARRMRQPALIGFLVLEGLLLREIEVAGRAAAELIGQGDLIHPGDVRASELSPLHGRLRWTVLDETELAVLNGTFTAGAAPWPQIFGRVALRAVWRIHGLALNLAISHQARIEDRLLLLFWHLAQRWGRVSSDGVCLPLPLTHLTLSKLVSSQRPSVTHAIGQLRERGLLLRRDDRSWLLPLPIPEELEPLLATQTVGREGVS